MTSTAKTNVSDLDALSAILASLDETPAAADSQMAGIDSLLNELETNVAAASEATEDSIVAEIEQELSIPASSTGDMEQVIIDLEAANTATAPEIVAADQDSVVTDEQPAEESAPPAAQEEPKRRASSPRGARFTFDGKDDAFFEKAGLEREGFMKCYNEAPVKAMDKIQNLMHWFSGGPDLSVYTRISLHSLIADKEATSNSLKLAMMSHPYKPYPVGTASTQAGQMMAVLPALGIATRDGKTLTLNADSPIVKKFMAEE